MVVKAFHRYRAAFSHWPEARLLISLALIAGLLTTFLNLAEEMQEGETHRFDQAILLAFRNTNNTDPLGPYWLQLVMADLTSLGGHTVLTLISLFTFMYLLLKRHTLTAWLITFSTIGAILLNSLLKTGFDRPRPDLVTHLAVVHSLSFPSGHAMLSATVYLTLGTLLARTQPSTWLRTYIMAVAVLLTILIGLSRIYLGVHWPTDVLAGWCIGAAWALFWLMILKTLTAPKSPVSHI